MAEALSKKNQNLIQEIRDCAYIILGMAIYAIGFAAFILPHKVVIGGMSGFGTLIYYATGGLLPIAAVMYGTNILLLIVSFKYLGKGFIIRTIFGATMLSLFIGLIEGYFLSRPPIVTDITMSVVMGATLCGIGIGLYYSHHGTSGGTDIIAAIMSKVSNISVGRVMMIVDMSIVACSFFLPFDGDMDARIQTRTQIIIYGWLSIFLYSYITDIFVNKGSQTIQFIIISNKWESIAQRITHETGRGVTTWGGEGYWTHENRKLMLVWCRRYNVPQIQNIAKEEDPTAYITFSSVKRVYGNGFDTLKPPKKAKA
jgi:uncharacterized membrane-anchored protein YitT (DUF2179 family)